MDTRTTNEERLAAAHAALTEAVAKVATSEDWQNLLRISGSFHRYSPNNQLLLAAQGAQGSWRRSTRGSRSPRRRQRLPHPQGRDRAAGLRADAHEATRARPRHR
jgi:hypothetical protein